MRRRIIIIMHNDLMDYPPMISLIDVLHDLGENVTYIGDYTESPTTKRFEVNGIKLYKLSCYRRGSFFQKYKTYKHYRNKLGKLLDNLQIKNEDIVWYVYSESANFIHDILNKYRYVIHYYEYTKQTYSWKYRLLYPSYNQTEFAKRAIGVVHCEYNRAQIFRAMNGLEVSPFVLPNKPYIKDSSMNEAHMPEDIRVLIDSVRQKVKGKKVILYQGYFESKERKLEEFCQAVNMMPDEYVMIAMGKGPDDSYNQLKKKYESDKILFIPFIIPPFHLYITQLASVGVLTYSPNALTHEGVVNVLYCAPNKIFEYGRYSKPMISNNIPGLNYIFDEYHCGEVIDYPITPEAIVDVLNKIFSNYEGYVEGAKMYYDSVNTVEIVKNILLKIDIAQC